MKALDNGMSDEEKRSGTFNFDSILLYLGLDLEIGDIYESGSGYETFTLKAAKCYMGNSGPR